MFAIPGLIGLLLFIYIRPQEIFEPLSGLTFLAATGGVVIGMILDWRLGVSRPRRSVLLVLGGVFFGWAVLTGIIRAPDHLSFIIALTVVAVVMCVVISQSIQSFRAFEVVAAVMLAIVILLSSIGIHQGLSPTMCIIRNGAGDVGSGNVVTDGRVCAEVRDCERDSPEPDIEYWCDHVGLLGTSSIGGRVRYRGIVQDPNELAWVLSLAVPLAFSFFERKRSAGRLFLALATTALVMTCVVMTKSRSGQISLLVVLGAYFIRRFRWRGAILGLALSVPLLLFGGRSGAEAESSSDERLECWQAGLEMWKDSPLAGVGYGNFGEHHNLTAHNSFVLTLAELGPFGLFLFSALMWAAVKIPLTALRDFSDVPDADVAARWAMALLAGMLGTLVSVFFLSIAYHGILWLFLGIIAAFEIAVRRHSPGWKVRFGVKDAVIVGLTDIALVLAIFFYIRVKGV